MSDVDLQEFVGGFVAEAEELVAASNAALLEIETAHAEGAARPRAVRELFRALHTIKGLAGMIGVEPIVEIAHGLETLVRAADKRGGTLRRAGIDVSLQGVAAIGQRVRAVAERHAVAAVPEALLDAIAAASVEDDAPPPAPAIVTPWDGRLAAGERAQLHAALVRGAPVWTLPFVPSDDKAARGVTIGTVRAQLGVLGEIIKVVPRATAGGVAFDILIVSDAAPARLAEAAATEPDEVLALEAPVPAPPPAPVIAMPPLDEAPHDEPLASRAIVRVELGRLDELQEQLSLLIVSRFRLEREIAALASAGIETRRLREVSDLQGRQLRDLRRAILRARMVRAAEVLEPLSLVVRSVARAGHKDVRLELDARDAELDKAVADRLLPALVHLVRNAVDHAIETPDERVAAGKPRTGTIRVSCHEAAGNQLVLEITDDGRGIDRAAIGRQSGRTLDDDAALLEVLTSPGFSTRTIATRTSGRGLGMDIVRKITTAELGGELMLRTERGAGTTFTLHVPVTIAVLDVFSFECGAQPFVVPVSAVDEILELAPEELVRPPTQHARPVSLLERRGRAIPLVSLGAVLRLDGATARKAVVIRRNGEPIAFAVDRMLGRHEVVVRRLDDPLARAPGIAGTTDLGDGRPTLVLDLDALGGYARDAERMS